MATNLGLDPLTLLASLVGQATNTNKDSAITDNSTTSGTQSGTSSQNVAASNNTSATTTGNNTTATNINQSTQNRADTSQLQSILEQQRAGLTPEALKAMFAQGAEGMPQLLAAYANATGTSTANSSPVKIALEGMMSKILQQAALSQQSGLNSAASTAAQIAQLTSGSTTSGANSTNQSVNQTTAQTGTSTQTAQGTTGQTTSGTTNRSATEAGNQDTTVAMDDQRLLTLLGLLGGGSLLSNGLQQAGIGGSGLQGLISSGGTQIANLLNSLGIGNMSAATVDQYLQGLATSNLGADTSGIDALLAQWATPSTTDITDFWSWDDIGG